MNVTCGAAVAFVFLLLIGCTNEPVSEAPEAPAGEISEAAAAEDPASTNSQHNEALLSELTRVVRKYGAEKQRVPKDLNELVAAGYLPAMPAAPPGKQYAIDKQMRVYLADQ